MGRQLFYILTIFCLTFNGVKPVLGEPSKTVDEKPSKKSGCRDGENTTYI
jgi:hypothetical protein